MTKRMLLALMAMAGVAIATYLTLYKTGAIGQLACSVGSCETVNTSKWSTFLGLPVAAWGLGFYLLLLGVTLAGVQERWSASLALSRVLLGLTLWGVLFSAWLTYLELFVIHAICVWCVTSAVLVAVMCVVSLLEYREQVAAQR
ncbi:MAG: vitamin K epoxide reductase family protein [Gemmatimonadaceae bacterium]